MLREAMSRYNQYGQTYDAIASQSNARRDYSSQLPNSSTPAYPGTSNLHYQTAANNGYFRTFRNEPSKPSTEQQQPSNNTNHAAAAALSSLSSQPNYIPPSFANRPSITTSQFSNPSWATQNFQQAAHNAPPDRNRGTGSPLYSVPSSNATLNRLNMETQSQNKSRNFGNSQSPQSGPSGAGAQSHDKNSFRPAFGNISYQTMYKQPRDQPPPRYNSPLPTVQAQSQSYNRQSSRNSDSQASPSMSVGNPQQRGQKQNSQLHSGNIEAAPATVDPSQVYDIRAEQQRKAEIEAEKRRRAQAEESARKAEEERASAEQQKAFEQARRQAAQQAAKNKAAQVRGLEQRKRAGEESRKGKTTATTSQQMLPSGTNEAGAVVTATNTPTGDDEEAQMRAMFQKLREFNSRNPVMLAKLWDEERKAHATSVSQQGNRSATATVKEPDNVTEHVSPTVPSAAIKSGRAPSQNAQKSSRGSPSMTKSPTPVASSQPNTQNANPGLCPPHKKEILADTAAKWLSSLPENMDANLPISKERILRALDAHPSYVQLCESIEKQGLKFERSALARELIKAVPDGMKNQPTPQPSTPAPAASVTTEPQWKDSGLPESTAGRGLGSNSFVSRALPSNQPNSSLLRAPNVNISGPSATSYPVSSLIPLIDVAREVNSISSPSLSAPFVANVGYAPRSHTMISGSFQEQQIPGNGNRQFNYPQPLEVMFEKERKPPANKEEAARKRTFGDLVDLSKDDSDEDRPPQKVLKMFPNPAIDNMPRPMTNGTFAQAMSLKELQLQYHQKRTMDSLQAQKPTPNVPQAKNMPNNSPPPQVKVPTAAAKSKGPSPEQQQAERMKGKMLVEPIMRDRVARKSRYDSRTIARDVLLATGRHPDMRALNAHLLSMDKLLGQHGGMVDGSGNKSDLSTIRWDVIDPGPGPMTSPNYERNKITVERPSKAAGTHVDVIDDADDENEFTRASSMTHHTGDRSGNFAEPKKRRGRPPRSSGTDSTSPSRSKPHMNPTDAPGSPRRTMSAAQSTPSATNVVSSGVTVGYSAFRKYNENGELVKKKGRPVGWRKHIHSREAQGLTPAKPGSTALPSRLRQHSSSHEPTMQEPHYKAFKCRWADCKAELHNLETLKKHIVKLHGHTDDKGRYECRWRLCAARDRRLAGRNDGDGGFAVFHDIEIWLSHINSEHLQDVAWRLGDGPRGGSASGEP